MASPGQTHSVEEALAQDPVPSEANEAMAPEEAAGVKDLDRGGGSSSAPNDEGPEKTLFHADELFEKGSKAIEDGDFVEAVDCLSRALEIKLGLRSATGGTKGERKPVEKKEEGGEKSTKMEVGQ
ncbi:hypothetical protein BHE74_00052644 [Ensete ventricosum]|nr:hypothetical protein BHE74_00052644 [Ensete ventricosum]RZS24717.1 hypothetical protein BHM03_00057818 [Ensete ventricosum]